MNGLGMGSEFSSQNLLKYLAFTMKALKHKGEF